MKRSGVLYLQAIFMAAIIMACKSPPPAVDQYPEGVEEEASASSSFAISQEMYDLTLAEVKVFVNDLNALILKKDYEGWKASLTNEFFAHVSSPEFLASASESAALKSRKIVLKTPNDYFLQVVVPSRSNSRVDEIEFTAADRVKVFYREERVRRNENSPSTTEVRRLRLYELKKIDDTWKIID
jgi:hypothetical protein